MTALLANPVALTVLPPLAAGVLLGLLAWLTSGNRVAMAIGWGLGLMFIYWLLEGVPPVPPVAAKQKLGYLIMLGAFAGIALPVMRLPALIGRLAAIALAVLAVVWLGWSKLGDSDSLAAVISAVAAAVLLAAGGASGMAVSDGSSVAPPAERPFLIPAALLTTAVAAAIVAASGLFLGAAQMLGALAAMIGGALSVSYLALLGRGTGLDLIRPGALLAVANALLCAVVLTALLAPSASTAGLLVLCLGPLIAALLARPISAALPQAKFLRPILAGAILAVPAIAESLIAVLTGTSPFA